MTNNQELSKKEFEIFHNILDMVVQKNRNGLSEKTIRTEKIKKEILDFSSKNEIKISVSDVEKHLKNYLAISSNKKRELGDSDYEILLNSNESIEQMTLKLIETINDNVDDNEKNILKKLYKKLIKNSSLSNCFGGIQRIFFHSSSYFNYFYETKTHYGFEKALLHLYSLTNDRQMLKSIKNKKLIEKIKLIYETPLPFVAIVCWGVFINLFLSIYIAFPMAVFSGFLIPALICAIVNKYEPNNFNSKLPEQKFSMWSEVGGHYNGKLSFKNEILKVLEIDGIHEAEFIPDTPLIQIYIQMISEDPIGNKILDNYLKNKGKLSSFDLMFFDLAFPEYKQKIKKLGQKQVYDAKTKTYIPEIGFLQTYLK